MLKFGGMPKVLAMPYTAVTRFYDPSVQFLLQFEAPATVEEIAAEVTAAEPAPTPPSEAGDDGPKVVSLDQFRKK